MNKSSIAMTAGSAALLLCFAGCFGAPEATSNDGDGDDQRQAIAQGAPLVAVTRTLPGEVMEKRAALVVNGAQAPAGPESFYLAINRNDLGKRFFLSAFLKVLEPDNVANGAASVLGTRVVTFQVQNGKLFVFDARDGRATSDTFDPSLVIEAYPLVEGFRPFRALPGSGNYLLFDPAAGLNRFHPLFSDATSTWSPPLPVELDLSYLQAFRPIADGATFEQVFSGSLIDRMGTRFRMWGTLAMGLRRYTEGPGFERFDAGKAQAHFIPGDRLRERNAGTESPTTLRWNIKRGQPPIKWLISDQFEALGKELPYDFVSAVKAGVENWNEAFGFRALTAEVAKASDSFAEDDKNYIVFDRDPSFPAAFASPRYNPNTGEIRGASVYYGARFVEGLIRQLDPTSAPPGQPGPKPRLAQGLQLGWGGSWPAAPCRRALFEGPGRLFAPVNGLPPKQRIEKVITHIVMHEIGHTLGLAHNFMGSLDPNHATVMDYVPDEEAHLRATPGSYDLAAIKLLYGLSNVPPPQRFCIDADVAKDPLCAPFDSGDQPLSQFWAPRYHATIAEVLHGANELPTFALNGLAGFLRAGTPADQARAWDALIAPVKIGLDTRAKEAAQPGYTSRVSGLQTFLLRWLFLGPKEDRGEITADPALEGSTLVAAAAELKDTITNRDRIRNWETRRTAVDVLKKMQAQPAYEALLVARDTLTSLRRAAMAPGEVALFDDLLARIDHAIHPYFQE